MVSFSPTHGPIADDFESREKLPKYDQNIFSSVNFIHFTITIQTYPFVIFTLHIIKSVLGSKFVLLRFLELSISSEKRIRAKARI